MIIPFYNMQCSQLVYDGTKILLLTLSEYQIKDRKSGEEWTGKDMEQKLIMA
jgi:hypothetical protein